MFGVDPFTFSNISHLMNWIPLVELPPAFLLKLSETQVCNSMFHFGHRTLIVKKQPSSQSWCISQCVYLYFATSKCICSPIVDLFDDPLNKPKLKYWPLDELNWTELNLFVFYQCQTQSKWEELYAHSVEEALIKVQYERGGGLPRFSMIFTSFNHSLVNQLVVMLESLSSSHPHTSKLISGPCLTNSSGTLLTFFRRGTNWTLLALHPHLLGYWKQD